MESNIWLPNSIALADQLRQLDDDFHLEEVKNAVWQLWADKAPCPDRFPILFYKHFRNVVNDDLLALMNDLAVGTLDWT